MTPHLEQRLQQIAGESGYKDDTLPHWFCFTFRGKCSDSGLDADACTYVGYASDAITLPMISAQKAKAGLTSAAVLISITRLGQMTKEQFLGEPHNDRD